MNRPDALGTRSRRVRVILVVSTALLLVAGFAVVDAKTSQPAAADTACTAPAWNSTSLYNAGDVVSHKQRQWRATQFAWPGLEPGNSGSPPWWVPWADLGPCGSGTTTTTAPSSTTTTSTPGATTTTTAPQQSGFPVEDKYKVAGPYAVNVDSTSNASYKIYRPATLSATYKHPILTWANGTNGTCAGSAVVLNRLASWGYVVVCWENGQTGQGDGVWQAAQWMIAQNAASGSPYFGKLDTAKVGALGHSQGAEGAVRATMKSSGTIKSTAPISFVDPIWFYPGTPPDLSQIRSPIMFFTSSGDGLCSPDRQTAYFNQVVNAAAGRASVRFQPNGQPADHNTINVAGNDYLPYIVAWFKYTLEGDAQARAAFVTVNGVAPEITRNTAKWQATALKSMP